MPQAIQTEKFSWKNISLYLHLAVFALPRCQVCAYERNGEGYEERAAGTLTEDEHRELPPDEWGYGIVGTGAGGTCASSNLEKDMLTAYNKR